MEESNYKQLNASIKINRSVDKISLHQNKNNLNNFEIHLQHPTCKKICLKILILEWPIK